MATAPADALRLFATASSNARAPESPRRPRSSATIRPWAASCPNTTPATPIASTSRGAIEKRV